ncbi:MAG: transcriptional regulator GcvA [Gammaproteobacteria bacterium]|nr:transcriptional regulator GcvA [Gammaproteobacteria bacterium]
MASPFRFLPTVNALRAFESSARHLNFTAAAMELDLTQSAVSHQIRELEARLDVSLFKRMPRGIELTEAGSTYLIYARDALERLQEGANAIKPDAIDNVITVSCSPNFAQKWLVPRLGSFVSEYPDIDLRLSASAQHVTFDNDGIDIAIRHGDGRWPGMSVTQLCEEWLFPVCSPHIQPAVSSLRQIEDLKTFNLIHDEQREGWHEWLFSAGADPESFELERGPVFSQTSLAIDAAIAAQGVALARSALVVLDLQARRLIKPINHQVPASFAYWIVYPKQHESRPSVQLFKSWLLNQPDAD